MDKGKSKILVLVEGAKTDFKLMQHLFEIYGISNNHEIIPYNTNIYTLYNEVFRDNDPDSLDILQVLKEHENDPEKKRLFDYRYSEVLLIFDLDPQDSQYSPEKVHHMIHYFTESSDMGKLYLNYPMVEAFYHMKSIPDEDFYSYRVSLEELRNRTYKQRVRDENRNHDYRKFAIDRQECNTVIRQNIEKAWLLCKKSSASSDVLIPDGSDICATQLQSLERDGYVSVLCTCSFYISDYNSRLIID